MHKLYIKYLTHHALLPTISGYRFNHGIRLLGFSCMLRTVAAEQFVVLDLLYEIPFTQRATR